MMRSLIFRLTYALGLSAVLLPLALQAEPRQKSGQKYLPEGQFVWHEIRTSDPEAATKFYTTVFNWKTVSAPVTDPNEIPYRLLQSEGRFFAGLVAVPADDTKAHWSCWVQVPDVDNVAAKVVAAGGLVVRPAREHLIGRVIEVADPGQARFALVQLNTRRPFIALPPIRWHLGTSYHAEKTATFYQQIAHWSVLSQANGQTAIAVAGHRIADLKTITAESVSSPGWLPCFQVENLRRSIARAVAGGARQLQAPTDHEEHGQIAKLADPQGAEFWLVER